MQIENVIIGEGVTCIGENAFSDRFALNSIKIPNSVTSIGKEAFADCWSLTSVTIPDSVTSIGSSAFWNCSGLTSVTIPNSVTSIGSSAFNDCSGLISPVYNAHIFAYLPRSYSGAYAIPDGIESIAGGAFSYCSGLTSVTIPNSVTSIGDYAFRGCSKLISVIIPNGVTNIGLWAFKGCYRVKEICVPKGQKARFARMEELKELAALIVERDNEELSILLHIAKGYELGIGLQKSLPQALVIDMQAAEKGCSEAAYHLGEWYEHGEHVPQDLPKALEYFQQAAKSGFIDAQTRADNVQKAIEEKIAEEAQQQEEERKRIEEEHRQEAERKRQQEERQRAEEQRKQEEEKKRKMEEEKRKEEQERREQQRKEEQQLLEMLQDSILFFDTETTGVPKLYKAPITNSSNWPRLVQLAWIMADKNGNVLKKKSVIIKPSGFTIPSDAAAVHGITTERAQREGQPLDTVMEEFMNDMQLAASVVGHNIDFDMHIIGAELYRLDMDYDLLMDKPCTCTMKSSTDFCAIPNPNTYFGGYKWPSLQELYRKLFDRSFEDAHDALADITATKDCYFELKRRGVI